MKRLFAILFIFLFVGSSDAGVTIVHTLGQTAGGAAPCTTPTTGDELNEGFLGVGYENSWTEGGGGTLDEDAVLPGTPPTGSCAEGFKCIADSGGGAEGATTWDEGTGVGAVACTVYFSIYIDSHTLADAGYFAIFGWDSDATYTTEGVFQINLYQSGVNMIISVNSNTTDGSSALAEDTWYEVRIVLDAGAAAGGCEWFINDVSQGTFTRNNVSGRYVHIGAQYGLAVGEASTYYIGYTYVKTP